MNVLNIAAKIKGEKSKVEKIISSRLSRIDPSENKGRQKRQELIDIGKFIVASGEQIEILNAEFDIPDFLIRWDGILFGLEHTEVVDQKKKDSFEKTEWLIKEVQNAFLNRYGDIGRKVTFSLKFEVTIINKREKKKILKKLLDGYGDLGFGERKLLSFAYPGYLTREDLSLLAIEFSDLAYSAFTNKVSEINHELINYISLYPCSKTSFDRIVTWSADSISDPLCNAIKEKESKIATYIENTGGLKQCLFVVIHGSNGYSDYSFFDSSYLCNRATPFDKVIAYNFFTNEIFILK